MAICTTAEHISYLIEMIHNVNRESNVNTVRSVIRGGLINKISLKIALAFYIHGTHGGSARGMADSPRLL